MNQLLDDIEIFLYGGLIAVPVYLFSLAILWAVEEFRTYGLTR